MKKMMIIAVLLIYGLLVLSVPCYASIYKYIDKDGIVCFADNLQLVPEQYRSTAVVVDGESKEDAFQPRHVQEKVVGEAPLSIEAAKPGVGPRPLRFRVIVSAGVVLGAMILTLILKAYLKEKESIYSILRLSLLSAVSVFLIFAHAGDVVALFSRAGSEIEQVQQRSAERGKKIAETMKKFKETTQDAKKQEEEFNKFMGEQSK